MVVTAIRTMEKMTRNLTLLMAFAALLWIGASCTTYRFGTQLPESQRDIAISAVENLTSEDALSVLVKDALRERVQGVPGIKLASEENAGLVITLKLSQLDQSKAARARTRDSRASHDDSDSYQTVLYRMSIRCDYVATPADAAAAVRTGFVEATADVPLMQDIAIAQAAALKELARDAAAKVLSAITEE